MVYGPPCAINNGPKPLSKNKYWTFFQSFSTIIGITEHVFNGFYRPKVLVHFQI